MSWVGLTMVHYEQAATSWICAAQAQVTVP